MKKLVIYTFLILVTKSVFAVHIVINPGQTVDVFTELSIRDVHNADTIFVDGGSGDIFLNAGSADDGSPYFWSIGTVSYTSYSVTFSFSNATLNLPDGSKGTLVAINRSNPVKSQFFWVVYRNLPLRPTKPSGSSDVCAGSFTSYTTTALNALSYEWVLSPLEAGTASGTSSTLEVNWSATYTGLASLKVKSINGDFYSPFSEELLINVSTSPTKPQVYGSAILQIGVPSTFIAIADFTTSWSWEVIPTEMANLTPNANELEINPLQEGQFSLSAYASNSCGDGSASDNLEVSVFDITSMQEQIDQLVADTTENGNLYRTTIADLTLEKDLLIIELDSIYGINSTLEQKVLDLTLQVEDLSIEINYLENAILDQLNKIDSLSTVILNLNDKVFQLQSLNESLESEINLLTTQIESIEDEVFTLMINIDDLESEIIFLNTTIAELEGHIESLYAEMIVLEQEIYSLLGEISSLEIEIEVLLASEASLQFLVDDLMVTNTTLQDKINGLTAQNAELTVQVQDLEEQIEILSQVYVLTWSVEETTTHVFETEIGNFSISLYPNPNPGQVFISCTEQIVEVKIYNLQGQLLKQFEVNDFETSFLVNRSEMPVGTYLVHIKTTKGNSTHKMIFQ
jgi:predicted  nucleic acid-binding Zn-ribbon protein